MVATETGAFISFGRMFTTCRTCTQIVRTEEGLSLQGSSFGSNVLRIKDVLTWCVPELDLNLMPNSAICKNCAFSLHVSYQFRIETLRNEEALASKVRSEANKVEEEDEDGDDDDDANERSSTVPDKQEPEPADADDGAEKLQIIYAGMDDAVGDVIEIVSEPQDDSAAEDGCLEKEQEFFGDKLEVVIEGNSEREEDAESKDAKDMPELTMQTVKSYIEYNGRTRRMRNVARPFKCGQCNFRSNSKASLTMHERIHTGETPFPCTVCPYKAKRKAHLEGHMKTHTGERPFPCALCGRSFTTKQMMKKHLLTHTGETPYRCLRCNFRSRHKLSIANHIKRIHMGLTEIYAGTLCICYVCGKRLAGTQSLSAHMRIHSGIKSHLCEWCGKYFRERSMLSNHIRMHTGEKPFKCTRCDYSTTRKAHLQEHAKLHDDDDVGDREKEMFSCSECDKRYVTKLLLRKHLREEHIVEHIGVGERPSLPARRGRNRH